MFFGTICPVKSKFSQNENERPPLGGLRKRGLLLMQVIDGALGMGSGAKDGSLVVVQDVQPMGDIGGMILTGLDGQLQIGA